MRILACNLIYAAALIAQQQTSTDARELLSRSGGPVITAATVRLSGSETSETDTAASPQSFTSTFKASFGPGGRVRLERTTPGATILQVSDGATLTTYLSSTGKYTNFSLNGPSSADLVAKIKFGRDPANFSDARLEKTETLDFGGKSVPCSVVHAAYRTMPLGMAGQGVERTAWISQVDGLVLRDSWEFTLSVGKTRITTNYSSIEWDIPLANDLFLFQPPPGSQPATSPPVAVPAASGRATIESRVEPEYTSEARDAAYQGAMALYVEIDPQGQTKNIQVMQGLGMGLDEKAVAAVKMWKFKPSTQTLAPGVQDAREVDLEFRLPTTSPWRVSSEAFWFSRSDMEKAGEYWKPSPSHVTAPDATACTLAGAVTVEFAVTPNGSASGVHATHSTGESLSAPVVKAIRTWKFQPGVRSGEPLETRGQVEYQCHPPDESMASAAEANYRIGAGVSMPIQTFKDEPQYSEAARQAKLQGSSLIAVTISSGGVPTNLRVVRMLGLGLDEKAMEAVKRWRFKPAMKDGKPVSVQATIEVNFRLL